MDFDDLYLGYSRHVRRFALFLLGDPALADDITSETFVRAWTTLGEIRTPTVKSYLFAIARNLCRDALRQRARQTGFEDIAPLFDTRPRPDSHLESKLELQAVLSELAHFAEVDRTALLLRVQEGMSYYEIARTLEISPVAARVKVHRARLRLMRVRATLLEVIHERRS
ncbi:MAG: sigma-70 family RNA polymerase sigma factor [Terriglobales bacterium]